MARAVSAIDGALDIGKPLGPVSNALPNRQLRIIPVSVSSTEEMATVEEIAELVAGIAAMEVDVANLMAESEAAYVAAGSPSGGGGESGDTIWLTSHRYDSGPPMLGSVPRLVESWVVPPY